MQDDKREYTPPVLEFMGTIRSLTRTSEVMGSPGTDDTVTAMRDVGSFQAGTDLDE